MKCPVDGADLVTTQRNGVQIEHCPKCRGVWLDRGELDKIIDKSVPPLELQEPRQAPQKAPPVREWREPFREESAQDRTDRKEGQGKRWTKKKRRNNWLEEIFDIDLDFD